LLGYAYGNLHWRKAMSENGEPQLTHHAMLIVWGQFAKCLGLTEQISAVPIRQKTVEHSPQTKIIEFLVANLAGLAHLKEIRSIRIKQLPKPGGRRVGPTAAVSAEPWRVFYRKKPRISQRF
jgi:hypothetical protein